MFEKYLKDAEIEMTFEQVREFCYSDGSSTNDVTYIKIPFNPSVYLLCSQACHLFASGLNFINVLRTAFGLVDPESVKNTPKSSVSFYALGIYERKSCT